MATGFLMGWRVGVIAFLFSVACHGELRGFMASPRQLAMGGAGIAVVEDETALFTNPAGLAANEGTAIHFPDQYLEGSYRIYSDYPALLAVTTGLTASSLNQIIGRNISARSQTHAALQFKNFAAGMMFDAQGAFYSKNTSLPDITFGYQTTSAAMVGGGFSLTRQHRRRKGVDVRVGLTGKVGWRRGGYRAIPLTTLLQMSQGTALLNQVIGYHGLGWGLDLGTQVGLPSGKSGKFSLGAVLRDVGNTVFLSGGGSAPDSVPQNLAIGAAYHSKGSRGGLEYTLAVDYSHILDTSVEWLLKTHFGMEIGTRAFKVSFGFNQLYWTAGVTFDLWVMRISALTYAQELGSIYRQDEDRRVGLRIDIKL